MYYLSFDVANKSLAVCLVKYCKNDLRNYKINELSINKIINLNNELNNLIKFYICEVVDILPNHKVKNTSIVFRANCLNIYLSELTIRLNNYINLHNINKIKLLIEFQPSFNDKSKTVFNQIIYHFSNNNKYTIKVMNPAYKNRVCFSPLLHHSKFLQKYSNNYIANKNHTKYNFLYFIRIFNQNSLIKNIKKKNYDDIADSFMQIIAFIKFF